MRFSCHWNIKNSESISWREAVLLDESQLNNLVNTLEKQDVIYLDEIFNKDGRLAVWGEKDNKICIDIQNTASAFVKVINKSDFIEYLSKILLIKEAPETYGFIFEE